MEEQLKPFISKLIDEKGLGYLEEDILDEIRADLYARLEDRINAVLVEKLPPQELPAFEKLIDDGTDEEMQAFVRKHIPNLNAVVANELIEFRDTYLAGE